MKSIYFVIFTLFVNLNTSFAQWTTAGVNTIYSGTGNIGIGNSSPTEKLDVKGNITLGYGGFLKMMNNINHSLVLTQRGDFTHPGIFGGNGWGDFTISKSLGIGYDLAGFSAGQGNILVSGRVGIGTTLPAEKLEVAGNIKIGNN